MKSDDETRFADLVARRLVEAQHMGLASAKVGSFIVNELAAAGFSVERIPFHRSKKAQFPSDLYRFFKQSSPEPNTGCWLWSGPINGQGYGLFMGEQRQQLAHRWSFTAFGGVFHEKRETVDHTCGQPLCVNPAHLEAVSRSENSRRMLQNRAMARAQVLTLAGERRRSLRGYAGDVAPLN